jgi:hypothetical protein
MLVLVRTTVICAHAVHCACMTVKWRATARLVQGLCFSDVAGGAQICRCSSSSSLCPHSMHAGS